ncbi:hypothetical protein [Clostridium massiliamazoniense]|nr:hypothetical protein [Clostridium massiliamazoniense]
MLATTIGVAIIILIGYLATLIIVRPDEIDFKIFKHISFKAKRKHKEKRD